MAKLAVTSLFAVVVIVWSRTLGGALQATANAISSADDQWADRTLSLAPMVLGRYLPPAPAGTSEPDRAAGHGVPGLRRFRFAA